MLLAVKNIWGRTQQEMVVDVVVSFDQNPNMRNARTDVPLAHTDLMKFIATEFDDIR